MMTRAEYKSYLYLTDTPRLFKGRKRLTNTYVLYHANCSDGFGAAYAAWNKLGDDAEYIPVTYGEDPPDMEDGSDVYIVDFSYPRSVLEAMAVDQNFVVVLDHHKTAKKELGPLMAGGTHEMRNLRVRFSEMCSGATMTWRYFFGATPIPQLLRYVEDRDLWKWDMRFSWQVNAAISSYYFDFEVWEQLEMKAAPMFPEKLFDEGAAIIRYQQRLIERIAAERYLLDLEPNSVEEVPVVNTSVLQSEVCHYLLAQYPDCPYVAAYWEKDGERTWSLRSQGEYDVSELAAKHGGGGNENTAGFRERTW